jgi:hypothetical protein
VTYSPFVLPSPLPILDPDTNASGTLGAAGASVVMTPNGDSTVGLYINGTFTGTINIERTYDGTNWFGATVVQYVTGQAVQSFTATGGGVIAAAGSLNIRAIMATYTSGSAAVTFRGSAGTTGVALLAGLPTGTNVIGKVGIDQTTPGVTNAVAVTGVDNAASTTVTAATATTTLLAANTARAGGSFYNDSTAVLYLKRGAGATTTSYTVKVLAGGFYELPGPRVYRGIVTGVWASATGSLYVTEDS